MSKENKKDLRFGIMLNDFFLASWQEDCLRQVLSLKGIKLVVVIKNSSAPTGKNSFHSFNRFLYRVFLKFFFKFNTHKKINCEKLFQDVHLLHCSITRKGKYSEHFNEQDINSIEEFGCDFILRFGFNILRGKILETARYGVWSYHHSDEQKIKGGPPGFWEIFNNHPTSSVVLQKLTDKLDNGVILKKGVFKTINHSYCETVETLFARSTSFVKQVCIDLQNNNTLHFDNPPVESSAKIYSYPDTIQTILFLVKLILNKFLFHFNKLVFTEQWAVGIVKSPIQEFAFNKNHNEEIRWLKNIVRDGFAADPFGYTVGEKEYLLFENYSFKKGKGKISSVEISGDPSKVNDIMDFPTHLSYPFLIKHQGELFCIPENFENREINLFQHDTTMNSWLKKKNLLSGIPAIDSSLVFWNDLWWLFFTDKNQLSNVRLFIYYSENFTGPFVPHENNPVKTDIRSSRSAGNFFTVDNNLFRPSQDCSETYGGGIIINKIKKLSVSEFEEEEVNRIIPFMNSGYKKGIHTLSALGDKTLIDSKRIVFANSLLRKLFN